MKLGGGENKNFLYLGLFFIAVGTLLNQWTIGYLRPNPRPIDQIKYLAIIWIFQFIFIGAGVAFAVFKNKLTEATTIRYYKNFSTALVTLFAGFVVMNIVLYSVSVMRSSFTGTIDPKTQQKAQLEKDLRPGLDDSQIAKLMKETRSRGFLYEPFTLFKEGPMADGKYVNVDSNGFRHVKNQESWPPKNGNFNIFIFGSSLTFNYGVPDSETIASRLQEFLRAAAHPKNVAVYNFGRGYFYSSQERALYEKLLIAGHVPDIAVFIDGQLEFDYTDDRPQFTNEIESFFNGASSIETATLVSNSYSDVFKNLPVTHWLKSVILPTAPENNPQKSTTTRKVFTEKDVESAERGLRQYLANKKLIEASSKVFGVKTFFVWQPISNYKYNTSFDILITPVSGPAGPLGYPLMAEYTAKHFLGNNFLYLADIQENIKEPLYIDPMHYSGAWSREVASRITDFLLQRNVF